MSNLVQTLMAIKSPYDKSIERPERIQGYSEEEIAQMQRLYNISIHGQFKELLLTMGKCSGAVLSGDEIYIYRENYKAAKNPESIINSQKDWQIIDIDDCEEWVEFRKNHDFVKEQFLMFAGLNEHMVKYFLLTANDDDIIYEYDENAEIVKPFGTLFDFLKYYRRQKYATRTGNEYPELFDLVSTGRML